MTTSEPEPMNGPPSWRCQTGAGNSAMFTSAPVKEFSRNAAVVTVTGGCGAQVFALFHPGLECVERPQRGIEAQGQRRALHIGRRIGEYTKTAPMPFDVVEQQRRAFRQTGGDFGDAADLELRVGAYDAPQHAELVDERNEFAQVFIHATSLYPCRTL